MMLTRGYDGSLSHDSDEEVNALGDMLGTTDTFEKRVRRLSGPTENEKKATQALQTEPSNWGPIP